MITISIEDLAKLQASIALAMLQEEGIPLNADLANGLYKSCLADLQKGAGYENQLKAFNEFVTD